MINLGFLYSRAREEEKLLLKELKTRKDVKITSLDDRECVFDIDKSNYDLDVLFERSISFSNALYALRFFEHYGIPTVNSYEIAALCGDKALTSLALQKAKVPTPRTKVAFTEDSALKAIEEFGYPVVLKPVIGSWARFIAKINDRESAETILEHKAALGGYMHSIYYIQEFIEKPGRDIRAFVCGDETVCAIYRSSEHWITNTARGGTATKYEITEEFSELCLKAANAVGNGILAIDLMEKNGDLVVHEVNDRMEFRHSIKTTGVNIPEKMVDYVLEVAKK